MWMRARHHAIAKATNATSGVEATVALTTCTYIHAHACTYMHTHMHRCGGDSGSEDLRHRGTFYNNEMSLPATAHTSPSLPTLPHTSLAIGSARFPLTAFAPAAISLRSQLRMHRHASQRVGRPRLHRGNLHMVGL